MRLDSIRAELDSEQAVFGSNDQSARKNLHCVGAAGALIKLCAPPLATVFSTFALDLGGQTKCTSVPVSWFLGCERSSQVWPDVTQIQQCELVIHSERLILLAISPALNLNSFKSFDGNLISLGVTSEFRVRVYSNLYNSKPLWTSWPYKPCLARAAFWISV